MKPPQISHSAFHEALRSGKLGKTISIILFLAFLNMLGGCHYYYKVATPEVPIPEAVQNQRDAGKFIILHYGNEAWNFYGINVEEESVFGNILPLQGHEYYKTTDPERGNRYKVRKSIEEDESEVLNEVHIYVSQYDTVNASKISIPLENIEKIEIYDRAVSSTVASWFFGVAGVTLAALAVISVIALLTKSSCPFIYVYNGSNYEFCGEIFSGSIYPPLERHDYLPLHDIGEEGNIYKVKMTNEVREIQHTNLAELIVVDHRAESEVLIDKYGSACAISNPISPVSATNLEGENVLPQIFARDSINYYGVEPGADPKLSDGAILEFEIPEGTHHVNLCLRAKNSFWLDYLFTRFHGLFGSKYDKYVEKQAESSREELMDRIFEQGLPISVYVEKDGSWEYQDYFNIAGPMAMRDDVLPLDASGISSGALRIKLEYGSYFWELDYVGLGLQDEEKMVKQVVQLESAVDGNRVDVKDLLISDDNKYYIQPDIGDVVEMTFQIPACTGLERSVFLHSKGHYKIIREQSGRADMRMLRSLNHEDGIQQYSIELMKELYPHME